MTYTLEGVKLEIDDIIWYGGNVQHTLSADSGYTVSLELESKLPEDTVEDLAEENKGDFTEIIAYYRDKKTGKEKKKALGIRTNREDYCGCTQVISRPSAPLIGNGRGCTVNFDRKRPPDINHVSATTPCEV
jgi:hypothetical protein